MERMDERNLYGLRLDRAVMAATIQHWDEMIARGPRYHNDDQLRRIANFRQYRGDRLRTCNFQPIVDRKALPLIAIRGLAGATSVPLHPGAARSVSLWIPLTSRATANGLVTAGALIGIAASYPGFGWLMDRLDWPLAFVVAGVGEAAPGSDSMG